MCKINEKYVHVLNNNNKKRIETIYLFLFKIVSSKNICFPYKITFQKNEQLRSFIDYKNYIITKLEYKSDYIPLNSPITKISVHSNLNIIYYSCYACFLGDIFICATSYPESLGDQIQHGGQSK